MSRAMLSTARSNTRSLACSRATATSSMSSSRSESLSVERGMEHLLSGNYRSVVTQRPLRSSSRTPHAQRQSLQEIAQQLVAAHAVVVVARLAEQCGQFGLGDRETGGLEDLVHVDVLQRERDPQLLQHHVVVDALLHRPRRQALVAAAAMDDQSVEEMRQHGVAALGVIGIL